MNLREEDHDPAVIGIEEMEMALKKAGNCLETVDYN